ncbi:hypothetical protein [Allosphingosinicella vermicomposti]|uniref:hypothetical protein n=1 Tax=Allosphingosinicella vermicomposti TaxID=614671 RepID=UPI000D105940|nr:hypothetical protein [Allosphingosinicella vermicomposti]
MKYENETFTGVMVKLDGNDFENCTFDDVVFHFAGGDLNMSKCTIRSFSFQFDGALANGLHALYQLFGTEGMLRIIRGFTDPQVGEEIAIRLPDRS